MEISYDALEPYDFKDIFPENIADLVTSQLEGFGYSAAKYKGDLVRCDNCYYSELAEIESYKPIEFLRFVMDCKGELLSDDLSNEDRADIERELHELDNYYHSVTGAYYTV